MIATRRYLTFHAARPARAAGALLTASLILAGCGDPAPGEGMKEPLMRGPAPELVSLREAVQTPNITAIDLQTLQRAEIEKVLGKGPYCAFAYTSESPPVLAFIATEGVRGVIKIHGRLATLGAEQAPQQEALARGVALTTEGGRVEVRTADNESASVEAGEARVADLLFELEQGLHVGYRGWYSCPAQTPSGDG